MEEQISGRKRDDIRRMTILLASEAATLVLSVIIALEAALKRLLHCAMTKLS
jgi:hypothetical protein